MRKAIVGISLMMTISAFALAETRLKTTSPVQLLQQKSNWELIQPGTSCIEHYQFLDSKEVLIQSNQERVAGTYSFIEKSQAFELPAIVINFITDNQQPDCVGSSANQAGVSTTNFLKMDSNQKIYFCLDALGKRCPVYLRPKD